MNVCKFSLFRILFIFFFVFILKRHGQFIAVVGYRNTICYDHDYYYRSYLTPLVVSVVPYPQVTKLFPIDGLFEF